MRIAWIVAALLPLAMAVAADGPGALTATERSRAATELASSRKVLLAAIAGLTPAQMNWKAAPDRWSVGDCVQHIAAAEDGYFALIERLLKKAPTPERSKEVAAKDDYVLREMQNRDAKRVTSESLQPGKWGSTEEAVIHFGASRDRLIRFVETTREDLRSHQQEHRAVGLIDAYQWVLLASGHVRRHTLQIEEVKSSRGFPSR
jgi:uncharacterized damage-inducible protein DinB